MFRGILYALERASSTNFGDQVPLAPLLLLCVVSGCVGGVIFTNIFSDVFRWTGSWFGGKATAKQVRTALAWSYIPNMISLALWIPYLFVFREEMFTKATPNWDANPAWSLLFLAGLVVDITFGLWGLVILVRGLQEVHQFSVWKALGSVILGGLLIFVLIYCISICYEISKGFYFVTY